MAGAVLGWAVALWVAAGVEAAWGLGAPGPLLLLTLAAGLGREPRTGALVGAAAGLCMVALAGGSLLAALGGFALLGALAGLLPRWVARTNPVWAVLAAAAATLLVSVALAAVAGELTRAAWLVGCGRAGLNALLMLPIYGIVLLVSPRRSASADPG